LLYLELSRCFFISEKTLITTAVQAKTKTKENSSSDDHKLSSDCRALTTAKADSCWLSASFRREELRVICGTRGNPDTVAPFRAWRGSRDLVAQSPKFHAPAAALVTRLRRKV